MRRKRVVAAGLALALAGAATAAFAGSGGSTGRPATARPRGHEPVTLKEALAVSRKLGPLAPGRQIHLVLALRTRHAAELDRLVRTGRAPAKGSFAARYGPDPALVRPALTAARRAGFRTSWLVGDQIASLDGPASLVESYLSVRLFGYETPGGRRFYAGDRSPRLPRTLRFATVAVGGLDDFEQTEIAAIPPGGVSPDDVMSFYNVTALRKAGLDGAGETVVFPELNSPADIPQLRRDLAAYDAKYGLPSFDLTVRADPAWQPLPKGDPFGGPALGEAALDVEIVHAIAPRAKLIIYELSRNVIIGAQGQLAMVSQNPTAIISDSTGFCEGIIPDQNSLKVLLAPWERQAAQQTTHYVASGDSGAYDCDQQHEARVDFSSAVPVNTSVGGTSVFLARNGGYYRESAWGNPLSQTGGGGGVSQLFTRPSFQTGPGLPPATKLNRRLVPDVAGLADSNTGWFIIVGNDRHQIGGTSAAAPLWAGITALINQDLVKSGLRRVGFASPALYSIASQQSRFHAFHDVRTGNNLLYTAVPGWDAATGLGTPDAAALDAAWKTYIRAGGK